jgi:hypothetical protein
LRVVLNQFYGLAYFGREVRRCSDWRPSTVDADNCLGLEV